MAIQHKWIRFIAWLGVPLILGGIGLTVFDWQDDSHNDLHQCKDDFVSSEDGKRAATSVSSETADGPSLIPAQRESRPSEANPSSRWSKERHMTIEQIPFDKLNREKLQRRAHSLGADFPEAPKHTKDEAERKAVALSRTK